MLQQFIHTPTPRRDLHIRVLPSISLTEFKAKRVEDTNLSFALPPVPKNLNPLHSGMGFASDSGKINSRGR